MTDYITYFFALIPAFIAQFQIWRVFTGTFIHGQLLNLLFSLLSYMPTAVMEERSIGTVPFAVRFLKLSIFINGLFVVISLVLGYLAFPSLLMTPSMGLWPVLMCDIVI